MDFDDFVYANVCTISTADPLQAVAIAASPLQDLRMAGFIEDWAGNTSTVEMREFVFAGWSRSLSWLSCINGLQDLLDLQVVKAA